MDHDVGLLDRQTILKIFEYLNARLQENQLQLEITLYGGSVMTVVYDNRPATQDIDCVFSETNTTLLNNILEQAQFAFNLPPGWINDTVKVPLKALLKEDKETFRTYSNLRILRPKAEQLLAMKLLAARSEPAKDFVDALLLCKELGITKKAELLAIVSEYVPLTLIGQRQITFIKYLGEDLGYDWK